MDRLWLLMVKAAETMETQVKNISTLSLAPLIQHSLTDSLSLYPPMPSGHAKSSYMWEERLVKVVFNKVIMTSADFSVTCTLSLHTHCLLSVRLSLQGMWHSIQSSRWLCKSQQLFLPLVWWGRKNYQKLFNSQILPPTTKYNCYEVEMVMLSSCPPPRNIIVMRLRWWCCHYCDSNANMYFLGEIDVYQNVWWCMNMGIFVWIIICLQLKDTLVSRRLCELVLETSCMDEYQSTLPCLPK